MDGTESLNIDRAPVPVAAPLATGNVGLIDFARKAGKNIFSVIPDDTLRESYLRGPGNIHYVCDPEMVTEILLGKGRRFPKSAFTRNVIGPAVGNGMILSEGDKWKDQRRRYAPLFAARNLPVLTVHFGETGHELAQALMARPGAVDVADAAQDATLTNISRVIFSGNEKVRKSDVRKSFRAFSDYISYMSLFDLMGLPRWVPRLKWLKSKAPITEIRALAADVIAERRAERHEDAEDFLDLLIEALEQNSEDLDTTIDNLLTFVAGGYETSANTIAWALYLLALHPDAQDALRAEVRSVRPDGPIGFDDLPAMPKLAAHIRETLRLYPGGALFARDADEDVEIKGVHFATGDVIMLPVYSLHRNVLLWEDPDAYRPERFEAAPVKRGQYIPFGDGPRVCIGAQYAETEITVMLATVLRSVEFRLGDRPIPEPVLTFTMRPAGPLILNCRPAD